ncbi:T-cell surface protein tactile [Hemicordylus capensis]|uniref:T-cell surface protein tactile n=1 Tax=Hemicordylus capensis TaxID=884348 RepID=UPI0023021AAD|nr:T-cell surface protein tactile [Hemicordylus capensis]
MVKMEIRWLFQAHNLFILTCLMSVESKIIIQNEKTVYAFTGSDVTLTCSILKEERVFLTQTQWSKIVDDIPKRIVIYHPKYGIEYAPRTSSHSNLTAKYTVDTYSGYNQWILHLTNVSLEQTGFYECSFAAFPTGISSSEIHLVIEKPAEETSVVETLLNQTLEIPCLKDVPSVNLTDAPLKWLMKENGNEEILITKQSYYQHAYITSSTVYKERIQMDPDNTLKISPVSALDDGKKFVCSVAYHPGRFMKSTTEVKVFVKPEISLALYPSFTGKDNLICMVRKAFPKPNLLWYLNGRIMKDISEGIIVESDTNDRDGFYEMRSRLTIKRTTQPPIHRTFKCMCLYPLPGNETRNISSEEIALPFDIQTTASTPLTFISQVTPVSNYRTERFQTTSPATTEVISQALPISNSPTERFQTTFPASTEFIHSVIPVSDSSTETPLHSTKYLQDNTSAILPRSSTVTQRMKTSATTTPNTSGTQLHQSTAPTQGTTTNAGQTKFSWPAVVAALILFCTFLIILGIRKWCQYQKEILNRPPSFKPPPLPVKYASIQEYDGTSNELENL